VPLPETTSRCGEYRPQPSDEFSCSVLVDDHSYRIDRRSMWIRSKSSKLWHNPRFFQHELRVGESRHHSPTERRQPNRNHRRERQRPVL